MESSGFLERFFYLYFQAHPTSSTIRFFKLGDSLKFCAVCSMTDAIRRTGYCNGKVGWGVQMICMHVSMESQGLKEKQGKLSKVTCESRGSFNNSCNNALG